MPPSYPVVTSFWGTAEPDPDLHLVPGSRFDVAVVGGGISGLSTAYYLKRAKPELEVAIIEHKYVGYGASGRNFGNIPQLGRSALPHLVESIGPDDTRFFLAHQARMLDEYEWFIRDEAIECEFERVDCLLLAHSEEAHQELTELAELHAQYGFPSELLGPAETRDEVSLRSYGGLSCGRNGYQQPFKLCRGFREAVLRQGTHVCEGVRCEGFDQRRGHVELRTNRGTFRATRVVFATNAYSALLGQLAGTVFPEYTYVLATAPLSKGQRESLGWKGPHRLILDHAPAASYHYMQLRPDGRFLLGGAAVGPVRKQLPPHDNLAAYQRLHRELIRRFPALEEVEIEAAWGGPLGFTETGMPHLRQISSGVYLNAGYNGRGALMGALSGKALLGRLVDSSCSDPDYERYAQLLGRIRAPRPGHALDLEAVDRANRRRHAHRHRASTRS